MSKETREIISSLMDGEISREASRFLVRRVGSDEELHATWARYHVVRDCLRSRGSLYAESDLCARVRRAIEDEDQPRAPLRRAPRWLKPVGGVAIAASVALVAVLAVNPAGAPSVEGAGDLAGPGETQPFSSPQGIPGSPVVSRTVSRHQMDPYLLRHYQVAGAGKARAMVGFATVMASSQRATEPETTDTESTENQLSDQQ